MHHILFYSVDSFLHEIYAISFAWLGVLGFLATYLLGVLISLCAPAKDVSSELLFYSSTKDKQKEVRRNLMGKMG